MRTNLIKQSHGYSPAAAAPEQYADHSAPAAVAPEQYAHHPVADEQNVPAPAPAPAAPAGAAHVAYEPNSTDGEFHD